jgi:transcriptional regulator of acetoin/glycerol metabolism
MDLLGRCAWPGNVRQLVNVLRAAAAMASGEDVITDAHLPDDFVEDARRAVPAIAKDGVAASAGEPARVVARVAAPASSVCATPASALGVDEPADAEVSTVDPQPTTGSHRSAPDAQRTLHEGEIEMIRAALDDANGNISAAARRLGVSRNTIYRKMRWNRS